MRWLNIFSQELLSAETSKARSRVLGSQPRPNRGLPSGNWHLVETTVLEAEVGQGGSKVRFRELSLRRQTADFLCPPMVEGSRAPSASSYKGKSCLTLKTSSPLKGPTLAHNNHHIGVTFLHVNWGEHIRSKIVSFCFLPASFWLGYQYPNFPPSCPWDLWTNPWGSL